MIHTFEGEVVHALATGGLVARARDELVLARDGVSALTIDRDQLRQWPLAAVPASNPTRSRAATLVDGAIAVGDARVAAPPGVYRLAVCPAGRVVAATGAAPEVQLVRIADGSSLGVLRAREGDPHVLALEADARRVVVATERALELWRGTPPRRLHTFHADAEPTVAALDRSSRWLVSGHADGSVRLWDTHGRAHVATLAGHAGRVSAIAASGGRAVSGGLDRVVRGWDLDDARAVARWDGDDVIDDLAWIDDETIIAATAAGPIELRWPL